MWKNILMLISMNVLPVLMFAQRQFGKPLRN